MTSKRPGTPEPQSGRVDLNPGDQAAPGTEGTGENVCRVCRGSGRRDGRECDNCGGTGRVTEEIGGA